MQITPGDNGKAKVTFETPDELVDFGAHAPPCSRAWLRSLIGVLPGRYSEEDFPRTVPERHTTLGYVLGNLALIEPITDEDLELPAWKLQPRQTLVGIAEAIRAYFEIPGPGLDTTVHVEVGGDTA